MFDEIVSNTISNELSNVILESSNKIKIKSNFKNYFFFIYKNLPIISFRKKIKSWHTFFCNIIDIYIKFDYHDIYLFNHILNKTILIISYS